MKYAIKSEILLPVLQTKGSKTLRVSCVLHQQSEAYGVGMVLIQNDGNLIGAFARIEFRPIDLV